MDTSDAQEFYKLYAPGVVYVEVENEIGDIEIGSAYHIGEGVFVTARHVVDGYKIKEIGNTVQQENPIKVPGVFSYPIPPRKINLIKGPYFHPDDDIDVACFVTDGGDLPTIPLGNHIDDVFNDAFFILTSTLIMGYPPIPFSNKPLLVATIAEINAVVDKYIGSHPHFVVSCMARGGFSGGVALSEMGFSMGIITESLTKQGQPAELGYLSIISVEPIYYCLMQHDVMPESIKASWDGYWG